MSGRAMGLDELTQRSLIEETLCVADSQLVLGHWYYKVVPNGRSVSDFIALTALAQDALRHTLALWDIVDELGVSAEFLEHDRPKGEIRSMNVLDDPPTSWEDFIATAYLAEGAVWEMLSTFQDSPLGSLAGLVPRVGEAERVHNLYFLGWMKNREETEEAKYIEALRRRAPSVLQWFGPPDDDFSLLERRIRSRSVAEARGRFLSRLERLLSDLGLFNRVELELVPESFNWTGWVREYRRPDRNGPPAGLMELIRPTHSLALLARRPRVTDEG